MKRTLLISSLIAAGTILAACGSMDNQSGRRGYGDGNRDAMRQAAVAAAAQAYADRLTEECAAAPLQWFNFYDFWNDYG